MFCRMVVRGKKKSTSFVYEVLSFVSVISCFVVCFAQLFGCIFLRAVRQSR